MDIEQEIIAKGLTAPRITPAHIESVIEREYYFTAGDAVTGELFVRDGNVTDGDYHPNLDLLTICVLVLRNGFTVTGESACASPENFNAEVGRKIARDNAMNKIWPLEGYLLKEALTTGSSLPLTQ